MRALHAAERPLVLVDNYVPSQAVDSVLSDNFGGGRAAVAHLVELGHREVAFIGGPYRVSAPPALHHTNTVWSIEQRAFGYWAGLREAGIQPDDRLYEGGNLSTAGGYRACQRLLAGGQPFTAIFCANDESAVGAMRALHQAGLRVPGRRLGGRLRRHRGGAAPDSTADDGARRQGGHRGLGRAAAAWPSPGAGGSRRVAVSARGAHQARDSGRRHQDKTSL